MRSPFTALTFAAAVAGAALCPLRTSAADIQKTSPSCAQKSSALTSAGLNSNDLLVSATIDWKLWLVSSQCAAAEKKSDASRDYAFGVDQLTWAVYFARNAGAEEHFSVWRGIVFGLLDEREYATSRYLKADRQNVTYALHRFCLLQSPDMANIYPDKGRLGVDWKTWHLHCDAVERAFKTK